jgi:hypothetical protein
VERPDPLRPQIVALRARLHDGLPQRGSFITAHPPASEPVRPLSASSPSIPRLSPFRSRGPPLRPVSCPISCSAECPAIGHRQTDIQRRNLRLQRHHRWCADSIQYALQSSAVSPTQRTQANSLWDAASHPVSCRA